MKLFCKYISEIMVIVMFFSTYLPTVLALETEAVHSLDELPAVDNSIEERAALIHDLDSANPNYASTSDDTPVHAISFSHEEKATDNSLVTLLAEKRSFDDVSTGALSLAPGFMTNPFSQGIQGQASPIDSLLFSSALSSDTENAESLSQDAIPAEIAKDIQITKKVRKQKQVPGVRGDIAVVISTGTVISTLSGEFIDSSKIGIGSFGSGEYQKAKNKFEKKMKNRGTKKKGLAEANVQGFEFGIPGTHLIFSQPVQITINTPFMSDGMMVDLMTLHSGDVDFNTGGLSVNSLTDCQGGMASIPGSQAEVKNGKVTFYTCGASSFTMNPTGGTAGSNDLKLVIGDCAQLQIYYNNLTQIYTGNPTATGCGLPGLWAALRIGTQTFGNGVDGLTATAWTTQSTTGSTNGNVYTARSTMTALTGGLTYTLIIDWSHTAPNKYFTWSYQVIVPAGNTKNVKFYFANDSFVAGADTSDVGYYSLTGGQTMGVYDNVANVLSAFRYLSGAAWTSYEAGPYGTVAGRITAGTNFFNTIQSTGGDLGFGVNWDFGTGSNITYSGTTEWRMLPYVAANVPDLIPGIGQPVGPLTTNYLSQLPITITNAGNAASTGTTTIVFSVPTNINGPVSPFADNGWSCGAQVGTGVTCTKSGSIAALGTDTVNIPVIPAPAASGSNVTFNVAISNSGDSNATNNTAFATNAVVGGSPVQYPGGVTGATLWLRGDYGTNCTTTGCTITTWSNSGTLGTAANAVTGSGTVTYDLANRINGNPSLLFNNASLTTKNTLNITTQALSIFTTSNIAAGGVFPIGTLSGTTNGVDWSTRPIFDRLALYGGTVFYSGANSRSAGVPALTSTTRAIAGTATNRTNGLQTLISGVIATAFSGNTIGIGRTANINSASANVGEVIIFPTEIIGAARNKVESYLAIKYGITLDQTAAQNYTLSNAGIAWDGSGVGLFKGNIAGIARDDTSTLNQSRSQSVTNSGDIIVSRSSAIPINYLSLMWANDGTATGSFTTTDVPTNMKRITREWQFQEKNGDMGTVNISYPASSVATGFLAPLMMLVDANSIFATGATAYTGVYNTGTNMWDFSANISDLQYVTFAMNYNPDSTPPNFLSNSVASGTLAPTGTFPITVTYADTGSLIDTTSFTGKIYSWDATGGVWSGVNIAPNYMTISGVTSTSTGNLQITNLPYGKYRFDLSIADSVGNIATQSYTYYVDAVEWTVNAPIYDIGTVQSNVLGFGSGEMILTVKTVGAGFDISMIRTQDLIYSSEIIPVWNGTDGWGYDIWNAGSFSNTLTSHGTSQVFSVVKNINPNGQKNTFTYRIKYGVKPNPNTPAQDYSGKIQVSLNLTY